MTFSHAFRRTWRLADAGSSVLLVALVFLGLLAFGADRAAASRLSCGDTITRDTTLKRDLANCPGNGIVIGADNITLDLNGHRIDGDDELGCDEFYACDYGVDNTGGHHGVTIEDGSIREFATGVFVLQADQNRLRRLTSSHNILGGLLVIASPDTRIEQNSVSANGLTTDQAGLIVFDSSGIRIERNSVTDNGDIGMFLIGLSDGRLRSNAVSGNPEAGTILEGSGNEVAREHSSRNGDGIAVSGDSNTVVGNHVSDTLGCADGCGFGISLEGGHGNVIAHNVVTRAREAGIRVADFESEGGPPAIDNRVSQNLVADATVDGLLVESTAADTLLERNIATGAGDDGIDVDSASTTLTRNLSLRNADLGIEAVAGIIDGGGNKARRNGNPAQCVNVICH